MENESSRLSALLAELHAELSHPGAAGEDAARRAQLDELKADIERLQASHESSADETDTLAQRQHLSGRLQSMVASFEGAHPRIASALEGTMNALSNMGL